MLSSTRGNLIPALLILTGVIAWVIHTIVISGVLAQFGWNAGNRTLTPINGILFINLVPVTTFVIAILSGYDMSPLKVVGAVVTIAALVANNLYQRGARSAGAQDAASRESSARFRLTPQR